ncbi:P-loop containing nucleoside triphosphate hydrolase protein [Helicostylum pulchrum]|uniref:Subunit of heteropentameric Replication factor C (RF-C) n=1 Tax=Helicostylum pulchrum TaxID=562976 RepID=A0ABP9XUE5_9FUNG|nr:P-loop containing nucleoside triphosphate hydrolase protein [Helicostylum pulchrum]
MSSSMDIDPPSTSESPSETSDYYAPWLEKYRPKVLSDIVGNDDIVSRLKVISRDGNMPNILLVGMPGVGKTTSVLCLAAELLGPSYKDAVLELNASDDRSIETVRDNIKKFAQKKVTLPPGKHKIIILDEADSMTGGAQQALRRTMELYTNTTRFALACNESSKIIEPLQSRCAVLRYEKLKDEQILERLLEICEREQVKYNDGGLEAIIFTADGDMRQAINNLQATHFGSDFVNEENVFKICDQPHPAIVQEILSSCAQCDINNAVALLQKLYHSGYASIDIINTFFRVSRSFTELDEQFRLDCMKPIGEANLKINGGHTSLLQLEGMIANICMISPKYASL